MKKSMVMMLAALMVCSMAACSGSNGAAQTTAAAETEAAVETTAAAETEAAETTAAAETEAAETEAAAEDTAEAGTVMTHEEFAAAEMETEVTVETYVQAKQSWWEDKASIYAQSEDGAYFIYEMACSQEDYDKLAEGTKIRVTGYKTVWSGEVEIADATFEIIDGSYVAEPVDVTDLLGTDELEAHQNEKVTFTGLTVEAAAEGSEEAFLYKWDGSGEDGDDLYFNVSKDGQTYSFTVESYLTGADTEVYQAVKNLKVGDTVDMEGFLYWYEGANPHITSVTVK